MSRLNRYTSLGIVEVYLKRSENRLRGDKETEAVCAIVSAALVEIQEMQSKLRQEIISNDDVDD